MIACASRTVTVCFMVCFIYYKSTAVVATYQSNHAVTVLESTFMKCRAGNLFLLLLGMCIMLRYS